MNPSKNGFLAKDEDDEGDTCHQTCTFIGHRVCNPILEDGFSGPLYIQNNVIHVHSKTSSNHAICCPGYRMRGLDC